MHEASLVNYILNAVERKALDEGIRRINRINIVSGSLRGAVPDLMQRSFRVLIQHRPIFENSMLEIDVREAVLRCRKCGVEYMPDGISSITCTVCQSDAYDVLQGDELFIESFEGETE